MSLFRGLQALSHSLLVPNRGTSLLRGGQVSQSSVLSIRALSQGAEATAAVSLPNAQQKLRHHPPPLSKTWKQPRSSIVVHKQDRAKLKKEEAAAALLPVPPEPVFAVIKLAGSQYKVTKGDTLYVEKIKGAEVGTEFTIDEVLLLGSKAMTVVGRPLIPEAKVTVFVEEQTLDQKVIVFKKKRRKGYQRKQGHRRQVTILRVQDIHTTGILKV